MKRERSEPQPGSAPSCVRQPWAGRRTIDCELTISSWPGPEPGRQRRRQPGQQRHRPRRQRRQRRRQRRASSSGGVTSGGGGITGGVDGLAGGVSGLGGSSSSGVSSGFLGGLDGRFLLGAASEGQGGEGSSESDLRVH